MHGLTISSKAALFTWVDSGGQVPHVHVRLLCNPLQQKVPSSRPKGALYNKTAMVVTFDENWRTRQPDYPREIAVGQIL